MLKSPNFYELKDENVLRTALLEKLRYFLRLRDIFV